MAAVPLRKSTIHHLADEPRHVGRRQVAGSTASRPRRSAPPVVHAPTSRSTRRVIGQPGRRRGGLTFGGRRGRGGNGQSVSGEESGSLEGSTGDPRPAAVPRSAGDAERITARIGRRTRPAWTTGAERVTPGQRARAELAPGDCRRVRQAGLPPRAGQTARVYCRRVIGSKGGRHDPRVRALPEQGRRQVRSRLLRPRSTWPRPPAARRPRAHPRRGRQGPRRRPRRARPRRSSRSATSTSTPSAISRRR